jgi:hypothetical protein
LSGAVADDVAGQVDADDSSSAKLLRNVWVYSVLFRCAHSVPFPHTRGGVTVKHRFVSDHNAELTDALAVVARHTPVHTAPNLLSWRRV